LKIICKYKYMSGIQNTILLLFIFMLFYLFYKKQQKRIRENFSTNTKIILVGDSIFQNENYVEEGESVENILGNKAVVLAKDDAKISDVYQQLNEILEEENTPSNYVFVSVGGNDLDYIYKDLEKKTKIETIFDNYIELIEKLDKTKKTQTVLSTIYYPTSDEYKPYLSIIKKWNKLVIDFAKQKNIEVFPLHKYVNKPEHFVHDIEPSSKGATIIANKILEYINSLY